MANGNSSNKLCEVCQLEEERTAARYWIPDEGVTVCEKHLESRQPVTSKVYEIRPQTDAKWQVECDECGIVSFDVTDHDWFGNSNAATWYAGYHSGKEHPQSEFQEAFPKEVEDE